MTVVDLLHPAAVLSAGDQDKKVGQHDKAKKTKFQTKKPDLCCKAIDSSDSEDSVDTEDAVTLFHDA